MQDAFDQLALPDNLRALLLTLVGAGPDDEAETFSTLTMEMYQMEVVAEFAFEDGRPPWVFDKSRLLRFHKELVKLFRDPPAEPAASSSPAVPQNIIVTIPESTDSYSMRDYVDQTNHNKFSLLEEAELTALRKRFVALTWGRTIS